MTFQAILTSSTRITSLKILPVAIPPGMKRTEEKMMTSVPVNPLVNSPAAEMMTLDPRDLILTVEDKMMTSDPVRIQDLIQEAEPLTMTLAPEEASNQFAKAIRKIKFA